MNPGVLHIPQSRGEGVRLQFSAQCATSRGHSAFCCIGSSACYYTEGFAILKVVLPFACTGGWTKEGCRGFPPASATAEDDH